MIPSLHISLLGRPYVEYGGEPVTGFNTTKMQALLYYLAVTPGVHQRIALAELLWGDERSDKARNSLRNALSLLNKLFPHHLNITRENVRFQQESPYTLDLDAFTGQTQAVLSDRAQPQHVQNALQAALSLYRGDFLAEFFIDGAPAFEEWVLTQREHWRQIWIDALQNAADTLIMKRAYGAAVDALERLLALEPWEEEAHAQLMDVYSRTGDFNAALAQYETCRHVLATELDIEPMPETTALYERIQVARQSRAHNLPADSTPFVGRHAEVAQLHNLLTNPDVRMISVVGLGGIGKTRLAIEAARQALQEQALLFLNGVCFVPLAGVSSVDAMPGAIFDALSVNPAGSRNLASQLLSYLANKELLLVLDNFEHLHAGAKLLRRILDTGPDVKLLITGREPLGLSEEWRLDLEGLPFPTEEEALTAQDVSTHLAQWESMRLFVQMAQQVQPGYQLQSADVVHARRLCKVVAGMPLALKLASSWLRTMTIGHIVAQIETSLDILSVQMRDLPPRQRSMRAVFDYTWSLLTSQQQQAMATLTVLRGGFDSTAADQVANATTSILADLVDRWLVQFTVTDAGERFTIHELTRQYAAEHLRDKVQARCDHARYFAGFVHQCYQDYLAGHYKQAMGSLLIETENVRAAWHWLVEMVETHIEVASALADLTAMAQPLTWFFRNRSLYIEGKEVFQRACDAVARLQAHSKQTRVSPELIATSRARLEIRLAMFCYFMGDYDEVDALIAGALPVVHEARLSEEEATALEILARPTRRRGDYAKTKELARQSAELFRQAGSELGAIYAIAHFATTAADEGDYALAVAQDIEILDFYRKRNDAMNIGNWLTNLANTYIRWGKEAQALPLLEEAYTIAEQENNRYLLMFAGCNLAHAARKRGDFIAADRQARQSLSLAREMGDQRWTAANLNALSHTHLDQSDWATAERYARQALRITSEIQSEHDAVGDIACLGRAWAHQGKVEQALRALLFVEKHPATTLQDKEETAHLLAELCEELPPETTAEARTWAAGKSVDEVAQWIQNTDGYINKKAKKP